VTNQQDQSNAPAPGDAIIETPITQKALRDLVWSESMLKIEVADELVYV
jgi:hypothetical protein